MTAVDERLLTPERLAELRAVAEKATGGRPRSEDDLEAICAEIAEAVMGNPTVEQVFAPEDRDAFKSDIQIEAARVLGRSRPLTPTLVKWLSDMINAPHPETMPGAHLTSDHRAQLAFAWIDNAKRRARNLLAGGNSND